MKKILTYLAFAFLVLFGCGTASASDSVLLWMVGDWDSEELPMVRNLDGSEISISDLVGVGGIAEGKTVNGVRIMATDSNGNSTYLGISDSYTTVDPAALPDSYGEYYAGPFYSYVPDGADASWKFTIELGNASHDGDLLQWVSLAYSTESYENLQRFMYSSQTAMQGTMAWNPNYVVPEPNSFILLLIGIGIIGLLRKSPNQNHHNIT